MSILSHIETAEESLRQALINALSEKQDAQLSELFDALNKVKSIINAYPIRFTDNISDYKYKLTSEYLSGGDGTVKYNFTGLDEIPYGDYSADVIRFPSASSIAGADSGLTTFS